MSRREEPEAKTRAVSSTEEHFADLERPMTRVPAKRSTQIGALLTAIGRDVQLTDEEAAEFARRDRTPHEPVTLD